MKKRVISFIMICCMLVSLIPFLTNSVLASTGDDIKAQIRSTYQQCLRNAGISSFDGLCGAYTSRQLEALRINTSCIGADGRDQYDIYKNMKTTSGGYPVNLYPASQYTLLSALNTISSNGSKDVYNIMCGFQRGTGANAEYGHAMFIHAIIHGTVYYSESYDSVVNGVNYPEGSPITCSISEFVSKYAWATFEGAVYFTNKSSIGYNPQGVLDDVTGGAGSVSIRGWAFDRNDLSKALEIHVYIGGPAGSGEGHNGIIAGASRPDVNNAYPGVGNNHGFSATIPTNKTGTQTVYVYAINVGGGTNVELGHKTITISSGHNHTMKHIEEKNATCTAEGNIEYWYCTGCRKYYKDSAGKTEISARAVVTPKTNHFIVEESIYDSLGYKRYTLSGCIVCGGERSLTRYTGPDIQNHAYIIVGSQNPREQYVLFTDVKFEDYFCDAVVWAAYHNPQITNGTSEATFSPDATCTRGQVVTFLWRAMGCPEPASTNNPFTDVPSNEYYYKAVLWAVEQGITNGTSATTFSPNAPCTRAHVVTFLWRAENKPAAGSANPFADVPAGQYYTDAVLWAVSKNITNGTSATTFSPDNPCTRGQIVTFLYRDMK